MLARCILWLSHGNAVPERGFSINGKILDAHGYSISEETIIALRTGKSYVFLIKIFIYRSFININNHHAMTGYIVQNNLYINKF